MDHSWEYIWEDFARYEHCKNCDCRSLVKVSYDKLFVDSNFDFIRGEFKARESELSKTCEEYTMREVLL